MLIKTVFSMGFLVSVALAQAGAQTSTPTNSPPKKAASTQDCGPEANGKKCAPNTCCSKWGYCGITELHCNNECLKDFGSCVAPPPVEVPKDIPQGPPVKVVKECVVPGTIAITYDDGPVTLTYSLLEQLKKYKAKVTFFVNGNNNGWNYKDTKEWAEVVQTAYKAGHQIASHSYSHPHMSQITPAQAYEEIIMNEKAIESAIGVIPTAFRFPYGDISEAALRILGGLGYKAAIDWGIDSHDIDNKDDIKASMLNYIEAMDGSNPKADSFISLQHDTVESSSLRLPKHIFKFIKEEGYRPVTIAECLGGSIEDAYMEPRNQDALASSATNAQPAAAAPQPAVVAPQSEVVALKPSVVGPQLATAQPAA